jgi:NADH-quinone oxidoreductase subunit N
MFSAETLAGLSQKLNQIVQGFSLMLPEILVLGLLILVIFAELFIHEKPEKFSSSWRYFISLIGLFFILAFAFQRLENGSHGFASFNLFWITPASNAINLLIVVLGFLILVISQITGKKITIEEQIGFLSILAGTLLTGISNHWLSLFLSIELMSLGTYLLVGIRKDSEGARAALPYVLFGMATSAIFLYGVSLMYGLSGTMSFSNPTFTRIFSTADPLFIGLSLGLISCALLFKMSWAPLHPWSPDVLETLSAPWMAWISIAPKIAVTWLGIRMIHFIPTDMSIYIASLAILTLLIGNLGALKQTNTKRLLAYSSIAHGGFMAMIWLTPAKEATEALLFYGLTYGLSTILVFFLVENQTEHSLEKEDNLDVWKGLSKSQPVKSLLLLVGLIALIGLPPAGTFLAKITYFSLLWESIQAHSNIATIALLSIAIFATAISVVYYLKIPFYIYFKKSDVNQEIKIEKNMWIYGIIAAGIILCLIAPNLIFNFWNL